MARHSMLKSVAHDLLAAFLCRNNDLDGYWGLGKLYLRQQQLLATAVPRWEDALAQGHQAQLSDLPAIQIDLLTAEIDLPTSDFDGMTMHYARRLLSQLIHRGIPRAWVLSAHLRIRFGAGWQSDQIRLPAISGRGPFYFAELEIIDDKARHHRAVRQGRCEPHDRSKEWRSTRRTERFASQGLALDTLEIRLMQALLAGDDPLLEVLRGQLKQARVTRREVTGRGFFASFYLAEPFALVRPANFVIDDLRLEVVGLTRPATVLLFVRHGCLDCLEVLAQTEDWPVTPQINGVGYASKQFVSEGDPPMISSLRDLEQTRRAWSQP